MAMHATRASNIIDRYSRFPITISLLSLLLVAFPPFASSVPVNVALNRPVKAWYTCGQFGKENYNTILDTDKSYADRQELSCLDLRLNGNPLAVKTPTHGPAKMVDGDLQTWWQSTSRNRRYHYGDELKAEVTKLLDTRITVDLQQEFLAEQIKIQLGDALSPKKVAILKSLDGKTFTPWIYAVSSVPACSTFFGTTFNNVPADESGSVCLGYAADGFAPADNINLDVSSVPTVLKEWKRIRYLEIKFYDMLFAYPYNSLANTFNHYAIRELSVMAECPCNGQQKDCQPSPTTGQYECVCGSNTKGRFCESCMAMFNQYQFRQGVPCEECNCFNHATSCFYQPTAEQNKESLDKNGVRQGGGVCLDCQDNTAGTNCDKCVRMFYRPAGILQTDKKACVPCQCSVAGSTVNPDSGVADCVMSDDQSRTDGKVPGECFCKTNVQGTKCDTCKQGFYNLDQTNDEGCTECACFTAGTIGANTICVGDATGQCPCKTNVQGRTCQECKDGFYALSAENTAGCVPCECDVGGAVDQKCDKDSGQCTCRSNNIKGRTCNSVDSSFYFPSAHAIYDEFEDSFGLLNWSSDKKYSGFSGKGYATPNAQDELNVLLNIPSSSKLSGDYLLVIFYQTPVGETAGGAVAIVSRSADDKSPVSVSLPLCTGKWCQVNTGQEKFLKLSHGPNLFSVKVTGGKVLLDKIAAVPVEYIKTDSVLSSPLPAGCSFLDNKTPASVADASLCEQALFSVTMYYWGSAQPCNCDVTGSVNLICDVNGGQCTCHTGVIGRKCDMCVPDHYGFSSSGCTPCNCDSLSSTCDPVTGQCECPVNTFGRQCELCLPGSWGWDKTQGCKKCNCHSDGAAFPQCNGTTGICTCKPGVMGDKCNECQDNFYNLNSLGCSPCACDMAGSSSTVCDKTTGQCQCKSNTAGRQCNQCIAGTFGLLADNLNGCLDCVCMGVKAQCTSSNMKFSSEPFALSSASDSGAKSNLQLATADGKLFTTKIDIETGDNHLTSTLIISYEAGQPVVYWKMPSLAVSNLLKLYGSSITVSVNYINVDGQALTNLKAIILTTDGKRVTADFGPINQGFENSVKISLRENDWKLEGTAVALQRVEFLKVLARGSEMLIPATFSSGKHTSRLSQLVFNTVNDAGVVNTAVEMCDCGSPYSGNSCENCAEGYKRSNTNLTEYFGVCVTCECNGHSTVCDQETSECLNCLHNTFGKSCEQCAVGFYGDATRGTSNDCLPCPCFQPRVENPSCKENDVNGSKTIKCDACRNGYIGDLCHECDAAYYGNPQQSGGTCSPCECNGNAASCDSVTGVCQNCQSNTVGDKCENCAENFYGDASAQTCQECACSQATSSSAACNSTSGQCSCVSGVGGRTCDKCLEDYWGFNDGTFIGCKSCDCNAAGSVSTQCAGDTGKCSCKPNTVGDLCDSCNPNFFGLPAAPCEACNCNVEGTVPDTTCDAISGQCSCQPGVGGRQCDQCLPLFVDFTSSGCTECGQCQKALGTSVEALTTQVTTFVKTAQIVFAVQDEDTRLQSLSTQLASSLEQVGLSGSDATSVTDVLNNIITMQNALQTSFTTTNNEVSALSVASTNLATRSNGEAKEQLDMLDGMKDIISQQTTFEKDLAINLQILKEYDNSASKLLEQGKGAGTINVDFSSHTKSANDLLAQVKDVGDINTIIETINSQQSLSSAQITALQDLKGKFDEASVEIDDLTSQLNTVAFNVAGTDNALDEALNFKSQAEELLKAVQTILTNTESGNTALATTKSSVESTVINTNTIYNGDARPLIQGEDIPPFPDGVTNFENGKSRLEQLLSAITLLVDQVSTSVTGSESHAKLLQQEWNALNLTFKDLPIKGTEANTAIKNYELVIEDLDISVQQANTASSLIQQVQTVLSGDALQTRQTNYNAEKQTSETMRDELVQLDYTPQVLESTISSYQAQLNKEADDWKQADVKVEEMNTAAQTLSAKLEDNSLRDSIDASETKVKEAATKSKNVAASVESQGKVLDQKEAELETTKTQIEQVKQLDTQARSDLNDHLTAFSNLQSTLTDASTARDSGLASTETILQKIELLETKLAKAESLLEKLRQPRTFDGSLSLQINNPKANSATTHNSLSLTVKKATDFTDGNIFFSENENNDEEFEVGILSSKVFFEFNAGNSKITVTNPMEICNDCWVKVVASRLGNVGYLSVTKLPSGEITSGSGSGQPQSKTASMTLNSLLFVGSLPQDTNIIKVTNKQFKGCLMDINFESQAINLWSAAVSSNQEAKCCNPPPSLPTTTISDGVLFTGFGFIVQDYKDTVINDAQTFSFEFRTFSSSGTMVYVSSENSQAMFSIHLSSGAVVLRTKASDNDVILQTDVAYNTGKWAKVLIEKSADKRQLTVSYLDDPNNSETKSGALVDLSQLGGRYMIYGASSNPFTEGTTTEQASSTLLSKVDDSYFSGCLRKIQIKLPSLSEVMSLDLMNDVIIQAEVLHGGCLQNVVPGVRFLTDSAYIQLSTDTDLSQVSSLEMKFMTTEDHGVLLYATNNENTRYLYVGIFGGHINVKYQQETSDVLVSQDMFVSDGQEHSLRIDMIASRISLRIDGAVLEESSQTLSSAYLTFAANGKLYVGGTPQNTISSANFPSIKSFIGGIMSFYVNEINIDIKQSSFEEWKDVSVAGASSTSPLNVIVDDCATKSSPQLLPLTLGILLDGASPIAWSNFVEPGSELTTYFNNGFTLDIEFASYKADGVLLFVANNLVNPQTYFTIYMENGIIYVKAKSSSGIVRGAQLNEKYNDGQRYQLQSMRQNDFVSLRIGLNDYSNTGASDSSVTTLDIPVSVQVYVAGIGVYEAIGSPLPQSFISKAEKIDFAGAFYSVKLTEANTNVEKTLLLSSLDRSKYPAVPQTVAYGISLDGVSSYLGLGTAVATSQQNTIELKISTVTESALLFVLYQESKYFAIDYKKNQIVLYLSPSFSGVTEPLYLTVFTLAGTSVLCDGKPHTLSFQFQTNQITVSVDGVSKISTIPTTHAVKEFTAASFFIGGLPDNAPTFSDVSTTRMEGCVETVKLNTDNVNTNYDPTQYGSSSKGFKYGCPT